MKDSNKRFTYRVKRVRNRINGTADRPRLSVHRGHKHIYAQIIDDGKGVTLASASTLSPELKGKFEVTDTVAAAKSVGGLIAKKAVEKGVKKVVFDRRGYEYTGKIKALADTARENGLEF
ncbi:50S ribosomal protein L18 [Candidatus Endomicrobiellum agilis]|jgi:large subunit ribosomal protein L18|uniref:50S ribosomal protein L18 n=1 Tax=Candidatus Endomicrobiellum agilis TaxID=3238957 RepID=UPI00357D588C|nr:50S ribosomal protein L18 [Endomicrobium sp.]MCA6085715.1 50S ribosomal protein L18 [Endomicrobium sp.]